MERDLQEIKEEIRARTDAVEIIGNYTRLKRSGKNWTGLCPFHADKRPSFTVNPDFGSYRCWSCGEKGDIFTFVQKKEGLEFVDALEWLARRAGIPFERKAANPERTSEREQMLELNRLAVQFFQDRLTKSQEAKDTLAQRGLLKPTQDQWEIGFAPDDWEGLSYYLQQKRVDLEIALKIGLIKSRKQEGRGYYDTFRNRLMFPIHDLQGRVIAFGGRAMSSDEQAKYLNSEQSDLFDKSRTLYGLHFARKKLATDVPPVFVEGYVDVITTHQAGFTQCVATLGTSMTEEHARMLARYSPKVIICYDGDSAGIRATLRGAEVWENMGVEGAEVRVARLPAGEDPDSLLRRGDTAGFQRALDTAIPRVDFQIEQAIKRHDIHTDDGRGNALAEVIPILASIRGQAQKARYADRFAYLHPLYGRYGITRAIEQILADMEMYAQQSHNAHSPRDRAYPLSEEANRQRLSETGPPPTFRPPNTQQWGSKEYPYTRNVVRKGENGPNSGYGRNNNGRDRRKEPQGDPTPPPLNAPTLTGAEKAERQLLRALFSPEWRAAILSRLHPDHLVTAYGKRLHEWVATTPATAEGGVDPQPLLYRAEDEERLAAQTKTLEKSAAAENFSEEEGIPFDIEEMALRPSPFLAAKFSDFIREVLEDSVYLASNEHLNDQTIATCIRQLQKHRDEQARRELTELLQRADTLPPEQYRAFVEQYHTKMRESKGSPPDSDGE